MEQIIPDNRQNQVDDPDKVAEYYRLLTENTVECIWLLDLANRKYKYISPSILSLRGLTMEEAMLEKMEDSLTPESMALVNKLTEERLARYFAGDRSPSVMSGTNDFQQYCRDGSIKDIEISTRYVPNPETGLVDIVGVSRDITVRKRLERELAGEVAERNRLIEKLRLSETEQIRLSGELRRQNQKMSAVLGKDELTGLYNRHFFLQRIREEMERSDRYGNPMSIILFDLDHFKKVNDQWGHDVGDRVLQAISSAAMKRIRKPDILSRWGGEEFIVLMPQTGLASASRLAERLRVMMAELLHETAGRVTGSFGVAEHIRNESYEIWFKRVDVALYQAKDGGRNRVAESVSQSCFNPVAIVRYVWNPKWESGNAEIDGEHRRLLDLANALMESAMASLQNETVSQRLEHLLSHIQAHFVHEEGILERAGYLEYHAHATCHSELLQKASLLMNSFKEGSLKATELFSFLTDEVIIGHLLKEDVKYFPL